MTVDQHVAATVAAYLTAHGPVPDRDLEEIERLACIDFERREAYWAGFWDCHRAIRGASNAISGALDWSAEAITLGHIDRARAFRVAMLRPRANDFQGREAA